MTTESITKPYRLAAGEGLADVWWKAGRITVKATGVETGGRLVQFEATDPHGSAPPMHVHRNEDELMYILDGEVTVLVGDERIDLGKGDLAFVPHGVVHSYIVRSERARMLGTITPGGFEQLFVNHGLPVTDGEQPAEEVLLPIQELIGVSAGLGCDIVGPPPTLADVE